MHKVNLLADDFPVGLPWDESLLGFSMTSYPGAPLANLGTEPIDDFLIGDIESIDLSGQSSFNNTPSLSSSSTTPATACSPCTSPPLYKPVNSSNHFVQHTVADHRSIQIAFTTHSNQPNNHRRYILDRVLQSEFYRNDTLEPMSCSPEGASILGLADSNNDLTTDISRGSIYLVFLDQTKKRCLFCNKKASSVNRALGCVRAHLNHRPFFCLGAAMGCQKCKGENKYVKILALIIHLLVHDSHMGLDRRASSAMRYWTII